MTLTRHLETLSVRCDACLTIYRRTYGEADFLTMMGDIQREGWKPKKLAGAWHHTCPDCARAREGRLL